MDNNQSVWDYERERLAKTVALAADKLAEARESNERNQAAIIEAKQELRENTSHSITNLYSGDDFEALAELNQYVNPIAEKVADYEATEQKIMRLEQMIQSPYFARIDFKFDDEDNNEEIYIGRTSLTKDTSYDIYVYDWRSPIAGVFYRFVMGRAYYDAPGGRITGELKLKRQYEINRSELEYFFDSDVQIVDEFLRKLLSQNTSPKMKTIVETIQKEQDIVIRDMENDLMMVQGVAGSGKTSIALHRAAYLMYDGLSARLSAGSILIISPNPLFEQYISGVLPELGEDHVVSTVLEEMLESILKHKKIQSRNDFLENLITGDKYRDMIKSSIEFKTSRLFLEIMNRFIEDLPHHFIDYEDISYRGQCVISKAELKKKVLAGLNETPLGRRLRLIEDYILETIRDYKKKRISQNEEVQIRESLKRMTELNIVALYKKLFDDREYFGRLAEGMPLPADIDRILVFTEENLCSGVVHYDDAALLAYLQVKLYGNRDYRDMRQVVIDEAQDYYPLHFELFHLLFPKAKFTILGDINQTLEKQEDYTLYEQIRTVFNKKKSTLVTMDKSFRCTNEILQFGLKFLEQTVDIKSFNRSGEEPAVSVAGDGNQLREMIRGEVEVCLEHGYQSVGLICKSRQNARKLYEELKESLDVSLIRNEGGENLQGIFIIPVYMSKGLEFDAVLICDADEQTYCSTDDKKLLYIACTRALHRLNLFCEGTASPLL